MVLIYAWATNAFAYAGSFNSHQLTAFLVFGAFYLGFLMREGRLSWWWIIPAGLMLGYAVICEYPVGLDGAGCVYLYCGQRAKLALDHGLCFKRIAPRVAVDGL